jgi:hypothetical protein
MRAGFYSCNVIVVLLCLASFLFGWVLSNKLVVKSIYDGIEYSIKYNNVKYMYSSILLHEKMLHELSNDCVNKVRAMIVNEIDINKMAIADYLNGVEQGKMDDIFGFMDGDVVDELKSYHVDWRKVWVLPECNPGELDRMEE